MKTVANHRIVMITCVVALLACVTTARAAQTDNAALLYYQALLFYEKPDATTEQMLADFRAGKIGSNEAIREHLRKNRRVIDHAIAAGNLPRCDWAFDYSKGLDLTLPHLPGIRHITFLLWEDAEVLKEQGDYRTALDRCISLHQMALHAADRTMVTFLMAVSISSSANRVIQDLLPVAAADVERLSRLKTQVRQFQEKFPSISYALAQEGQTCALTMRKEETQTILRMMRGDSDSPKNESLAARISVADEAFFERNRAHWLNAIATLTRTVESGLAYAEMCTRLDELDQRFCDEAKDNPDATLTAFVLPATRKIYQIVTAQQTHFHAVRTALDLYIGRATTGRLPDTLPADALGDLFSGKPFLYEKANDRFILRCQAKMESKKTEANQYEFKIKQ